VILFHFTTYAALKHNNPKLFDGIPAGDSFRWTDDLKPGPDSWYNWRDVIIGVGALPPVVWLTADPNPKKALREADLRFRLAMGSHTRKLIRFEDYLIASMSAKEEVKRFFESPAALTWNYGWKEWWLHFGPVPCDRIRALEEI
jgi:hypothetical protein